jgi:hypothetical protein
MIERHAAPIKPFVPLEVLAARDREFKAVQFRRIEAGGQAVLAGGTGAASRRQAGAGLF